MTKVLKVYTNNNFSGYTLQKEINYDIKNIKCGGMNKRIVFVYD